jgi:hypothetical protein
VRTNESKDCSGCSIPASVGFHIARCLPGNGVDCRCSLIPLDVANSEARRSYRYLRVILEGFLTKRVERISMQVRGDGSGNQLRNPSLEQRAAC